MRSVWSRDRRRALKGRAPPALSPFAKGCSPSRPAFYDMVLIGGVEDMSKRSTREVAEGLALAAVPYERKSGFTFPGVFGTIATAYFDRYGASREHLMNVTIKMNAGILMVMIFVKVDITLM